MTDNE